jgi:hypothetical protein
MGSLGADVEVSWLRPSLHQADDNWPSESDKDEEPTPAEQFRRGLALGALILKWLNVNLEILRTKSSAHKP